MSGSRDDLKERVRDATDLAALVGERVELRRSSATRLVGLCPFHDERTPSFGVDPTKGLFHCFGCGEGGDVFSWVEKTEGVGFREALELLAERAGIPVEREDDDPRAAARRKHRDRMTALLERTAAYYARVLWEASEARLAREHLAARGLGEEALRPFGVGYAPSRFDAVLTASKRAGFSAREVFDAGLSRRGAEGGRLYDAFRGRLMFPLADRRGRVVGFGARALRDGQGPKYVNTPEGELFHKGRMLYGAHLARPGAAKAGAVVLCEGYTDVIALHAAGVPVAVAAMGTALTSDQVAELKRLAPVCVLALDADAAGRKAMRRAAQVAKGSGLALRVVELPAGSDPADLAQSEGSAALAARFGVQDVEGGAADLTAVAGAGVPFVRWWVEAAIEEGDLSTAEGKDAVLREVGPALRAMGPSVLREELLQVVSDRLDVPATLVVRVAGLHGSGGRGGGGRSAAARSGREEGGVQRPRGEGAGSPDGPAAVSANGSRRVALDRTAIAERAFLALCVRLPQDGARELRSLDLEADLTDPEARRAAAWLRDHPLADPPAGDEDLARVLLDLRARAEARTGSAASLEAESLALRIAAIDRRIARRGAPDGTTRSELAAQRRALKEAYAAALDRAVSGS